MDNLTWAPMGGFDGGSNRKPAISGRIEVQNLGGFAFLFCMFCLDLQNTLDMKAKQFLAQPGHTGI